MAEESIESFMEWLDETVPPEKELKCDLCDENTVVPFDWKLVTICNVCFGHMRKWYMKKYGYPDKMKKFEELGPCPRHHGRCICDPSNKDK